MKKKLNISWLVIGIAIFILMSFLLTNKASAVADPQLNNIALAQGQKSIVTFDDNLYLDVDFGVTQEEVVTGDGTPDFFYPTVRIKNAITGEKATIYIGDVFGSPYIRFTNMSTPTVSPGKYSICEVTVGNKDYTNEVTGALPLNFNVEFYLVNTYDVMKSFSVTGNNLVMQNGIITFNTNFDITPEKIAVAIRGDNGTNLVQYLAKVGENQYTLNTSNTSSGALPVGSYQISKVYLFYGNSLITYGGSGEDAGLVANNDFNFNVEFYITSTYDVMKSFSIEGKTIILPNETITINTDFEVVPQSISVNLKSDSGHCIAYLEKVAENQYTLDISNTSSGALSAGGYQINSVYLFYGNNRISYGTVRMTTNELAHYDTNINETFYIMDTYDVLKDLSIVGNSIVPPNGLLTLNVELEVVPRSIAVSVRNGGIYYLVRVAGNQYTLNTGNSPSGALPLGNYKINKVILFYGNNTITYGGSGYDAGLVANYDLNYDVNFSVAEKSFPDVELGKWYSVAIQYCKDNGLMSGYASGANAGNFGLNDSITRGQIVTILYRLAGEPDTTALENPFTDVLAGKYYTEPIKWAFSKGITTGKTATTFDPEGYITRQELAVFMTRYASIIENVDVTSTYDISEIADYADISSWAIAPLQYIMEKGVITGDMALGYARILPKSNATRAVAATMLMRFCQNVLNMQ